MFIERTFFTLKNTEDKSISVSGLCGSPITCSKDATKRYTGTHTSAYSNDWYYDGQVVLNPHYETRALACRKYCQGICEKQRSPYPWENWTGCKAFTSLVNSGGGRCQCWGWDHKPNFEGGWSKDYRSGWCES